MTREITQIGDWRRAPELDKRICKGDPWAGDAWRNTKTNEVRHCVVQHTPDPENW